DTQVRSNLELVLHEPARLVRAEVTIGIALQECRRDKSVCRIGDGLSSQEVGKINKANHPSIRTLITGIHLRVGVAAAESEGVLPMRPDRAHRRNPPVLENTGESALRSRRGTDIHARIERCAARRRILTLCAIARV